MVFFSKRVDRDEIRPGDHIFVWRTLSIYAHHGIYVGNNKVIHFTSDVGKATSTSGLNIFSSISISSSFSNSTYCEFSQPVWGHSCDSDSGSCLCSYKCGFHQPESGITLSCLNCFSKRQSLCLYEYSVSKWTFVNQRRGGTCTTASSDTPRDVIDRAMYLLRQQKGFGNYDLYNNNCEDFALYCKTGLLISGSARSLYARCSGQMNSRLVFERNPVIRLIPFFYRHWGLYDYDIGVRGDVVKFPMERVGQLKLSRGF